MTRKPFLIETLLTAHSSLKTFHVENSSRITVYGKNNLRVGCLVCALLLFSSCAGSFDNVDAPIVNVKLEDGTNVRCKWATNRAGGYNFKLCEDGLNYLHQRNVELLRIE
ncbi:MAG TPA: hypothetical protein VD913_02510 [bacterium]|nr:hypothetical protein [bacterium]